MNKIFALVLVSIFCAATVQALPASDAPLKLQRADVALLSEQYPYLKKDKEAGDAFMDKNPKINKFEVMTATVTDKNSNRKFLIIQEQGSFACGTQNCPLKVYDVTNEKSPKRVLNKIAPPVVNVAQCPATYSLVLSGNGKTYQRWTSGKKSFKMIDTYKSLEEASACD